MDRIKPGMMMMTAGKAIDNKFMMDAMIGNSAEIAMGQMAMKKVASQEVKESAKMMINDHTAAQTPRNPRERLKTAAVGAMRAAKTQTVGEAGE